MFFEVLVSLLGKQGVAIHDVNITETGEVKIDIDFTEHDKVFEDKIDRLETMIKLHQDKRLVVEEENHKLKKYIDEIEEKNKNLANMVSELQLDKVHLEDKIVELEDEISKLKQELSCYSYAEYISKSYENAKSKLKQQIAEYGNNQDTDLPFDALETANYLINATYERETNGIERTFCNLPDKVSLEKYSIDDLEQIAEHLLVYCKHNRESE